MSMLNWNCGLGLMTTLISICTNYDFFVVDRKMENLSGSYRACRAKDKDVK